MFLMIIPMVPPLPLLVAAAAVAVGSCSSIRRGSRQRSCRFTLERTIVHLLEAVAVVMATN